MVQVSRNLFFYNLPGDLAILTLHHFEISPIDQRVAIASGWLPASGVKI